MYINLSPSRREETLTLYRTGDTLTFNGVDYDFGPLPDGATLPQEAVSCEWLDSNVERINGVLHLTLILPFGPNPPQETLFPEPIIDPPDGFVPLPEYGTIEEPLE